MKILTPLSQKSIFLAKRGVKNSKSAQKSTMPDWAQIFMVVQAQQMIKDGDEKFDPSQKSIFG